MSRALDALVAERVVGKPQRECPHPPMMFCSCLPWKKFSTDIAAAWEAMQRFAKAGGCCMIEMDGHTGGHALVTTGSGRFEGHADSPAVAACIAMLRAVGVDEDTIREASDP